MMEMNYLQNILKCPGPHSLKSKLNKSANTCPKSQEALLARLVIKRDTSPYFVPLPKMPKFQISHTMSFCSYPHTNSPRTFSAPRRFIIFTRKRPTQLHLSLPSLPLFTLYLSTPAPTLAIPLLEEIGECSEEGGR